MVQNAILQCDMNLVMMPDIVHLHIDYEFPCDSIASLAEWMPNLKVLKLILENTTFGLVCKKWPKIQELVCLSGSEIDDFALTGWNKNDGVPAKDESIHAAITDLECK